MKLKFTITLMASLCFIGSLMAQQPTMDQFMGTNVFVNDPPDMIADVAGVVREYHPWSFSVPDADDGMPDGGYTSATVEYSFNRWGGFWNFDQFYADLQFRNVEICPALWQAAPWMTGIPEDAPVEGAGSRTAAASYMAKADYMYQYAARYGTVAVEESTLKVHANQTVRTGWNKITYYEDWNEQDRTWNGPNAQFSPEEYAAMASASVDGHGGTMGAHLGIKAADPNAKFVMGGLAELGTDYVTAMKTWFDANRPQGDWPIDVINMHHYCNEGSDAQGGAWTFGESPEANGLKDRINNVLTWRDTNAPNAEFWLTEWGWDTEASSDLYIPTYASLTAFDIQSMWLMRGYMIMASTGMERSIQFMFRDPTGWGGRFNTCGITGPTLESADGAMADDMDSGDRAQSWIPKKSYFHLAAMKSTLTGLFFDEVVEETATQYVYKFSNADNSKVAYALWSPTSDASTVTGYSLNVGSASDVNLVEMHDSNKAGTVSSLTVSGGNVSVDIGELPVFVTVGNFFGADTEVPTAPSGLAGIVEGTTITLNWNPGTDNKAVTGYKVYQNEVLIATVEGFEKELKGLDALQSFTFKVSAVDAAGNESAMSNELTISTGVALGVGEYVVSIVATPPTIDGTLDAIWSNITEIDLANVSGTVDSETDLAGSFKMCYDASNLYLFVMVTDEIISKSGTYGWDEDNIEVFFDMENEHDGSSCVGTMANYDRDNMQYRFVPGKTSHTGDPSNLVWTGVTEASTESSSGYTVEIKFPWTTLMQLMPGSITIEDFTKIGFEIKVHDKDWDGFEGNVAWNNDDEAVASHLTDENYGELRLSDPNNPNGLEDAVAPFTLIPNPSNGVFRIRLETAEAQAISVTDLMGRIVYVGVVEGQMITVDLSTYPKGIYVIRVMTTEGDSSAKIVIE